MDMEVGLDKTLSSHEGCNRIKLLIICVHLNQTDHFTSISNAKYRVLCLF